MADIPLGSHYERFVRDQVASGRYRDEGEVVREGLRLVEERDRKLAQLRQEIQDAIAGGGSHTEADIRADLAAMIAAEEEGR